MDERFRRLERAAAYGDVEAIEQLSQIKKRLYVTKKLEKLAALLEHYRVPYEISKTSCNSKKKQTAKVCLSNKDSTYLNTAFTVAGIVPRFSYGENTNWTDEDDLTDEGLDKYIAYHTFFKIVEYYNTGKIEFNGLGSEIFDSDLAGLAGEKIREWQATGFLSGPLEEAARTILNMLDYNSSDLVS